MQGRLPFESKGALDLRFWLVVFPYIYIVLCIVYGILKSLVRCQVYSVQVHFYCTQFRLPGRNNATVSSCVHKEEFSLQGIYPCNKLVPNPEAYSRIQCVCGCVVVLQENLQERFIFPTLMESFL